MPHMGVSLNLSILVLFYTHAHTHAHTHTFTGYTNCLSFHEVREIFIYYTEYREHYLAEEV